MAEATNVGSVSIGIEIEDNKNLQNEANKVAQKTGNTFSNGISNTIKRNNIFKNAFKISQKDIPVPPDLNKLFEKRDANYYNTKALDTQLSIIKKKMQDILEVGGSKDSEAFKKLSIQLNKAYASSTKLKDGLNDINSKIAELEKKEKQAIKSTTLFGRLQNSLGKAFRKSSNDVKSSNNGLINFERSGRSIARNLLGITFAVRLAGRAFRSFASYVANGLSQNKAFTKSLNIVKSNLAVAFQPVLTAIAPALNYLTGILGQVTGAIAAFMSIVSGRSIADSYKSAKAIEQIGKAAKGTGGSVKDAQRILASFDQLNDITENEPSGGGGNASVSEELPPPDLSGWEKFKSIINETVNSLFPLWNMLNNIWKLVFVPAGKTLFSFITEGAKGLLKIISVLSPIFDAISESMQKNEKTAKLLGLALAGIGVVIAFSIAPTVTTILGLAAAFNYVWERSELFRTIVTKAVEGVAWVIRKVADGIEASLNGIIYWIDKLSKAWKNMGDWFNRQKNNITNGIATLRTGFNNFVTWIKTGFSNAWGQAWSAVTGKFRSIFGGLINIAKIPINALIRLLNTFLSGLNRIKIPSWVPGLGGLGFNIPKIPQLASGGVLKKPTLALAGEYPGASRNPEIVTPQNIMRDTFKEVLGDFTEALLNGKEPSEQTMQLAIDIGGIKFVDTVVTLIREYETLTGKAVSI